MCRGQSGSSPIGSPSGARCSIRRVRGEQRDDVGGQIGGHVRPDRVRGGEPVLGELDRGIVAVDDAHAERGIAGRAGQPGRPVRRRGPDLAVRDPLVAELGAGEQRVVGVDQRLVGAAVLAQRGSRPGNLGRLEVRVHVGAAERVDRLLGVGDEHERDAPFRERAIEDLPLDRVGVLELVDEHDVEPGAQACAGGLATRARRACPSAG